MKQEPYGDTAAEQKQSADLRFQRYQTLALLTATATLVWSLASTENGQQVCRVIAEMFK